MSHEFCGVFVHRGQLYVAREERVGGPRRMILPPRKLNVATDSMTLGGEIVSALNDYRDSQERMNPQEWEKLNEELLRLVGEESIEKFGRNKRDVTVRRDSTTSEIHLLGPKGVRAELHDPSPHALGEAVRTLLRLGGKSSTR